MSFETSGYMTAQQQDDLFGDPTAFAKSPRVGQVVGYRDDNFENMGLHATKNTPYVPAMVTYVWNSEVVELTVYPIAEKPFTASSVARGDLRDVKTGIRWFFIDTKPGL